MERGESPVARTKRTTLSLPIDYLERAERIAQTEHSTVSTIIARALAKGLPLLEDASKGDEVLASYRQAFAGFSEEDLLLLEGIVLEPIGPDNPDPDEN